MKPSTSPRCFSSGDIFRFLVPSLYNKISYILKILRIKTYSTREPTPTHITHTTRNKRELKKLSLCKRALRPARHALEDTSHRTRAKIDAGGASLLTVGILSSKISDVGAIFGPLVHVLPGPNKNQI
jgi:hypothetical protein